MYHDITVSELLAYNSKELYVARENIWTWTLFSRFCKQLWQQVHLDGRNSKIINIQKDALFIPVLATEQENKGV